MIEALTQENNTFKQEINIYRRKVAKLQRVSLILYMELLQKRKKCLKLFFGFYDVIFYLKIKRIKQ